MEDLGNINITIREMGGGGGGGGGQPGTGPNIVPGGGQPGGGRGGQPGGGPSAKEPQQSAFITKTFAFLASLGKLSEIGGEIGGFLARPSVAGIASLGSTASATGGALASLTGAFAIAAPVVLGAIAAIGVAVVGLKLLSAASERIAERIQQVTRFSGPLMYATAVERMQQFQRQLSEATRNGFRYSESQRLATAANDKQAMMMENINALSAEMAIIWQRLRYAAFTVLEPLSRLAGTVAFVFANFNTIMAIFRMGGPLQRFIAFMYDAINLVLKYLGLVASNTAPAPGTGINNWFIGDVQAASGRKY